MWSTEFCPAWGPNLKFKHVPKYVAYGFGTDTHCAYCKELPIEEVKVCDDDGSLENVD